VNHPRPDIDAVHGEQQHPPPDALPHHLTLPHQRNKMQPDMTGITT
jgi:hypothetical protein